MLIKGALVVCLRMQLYWSSHRKKSTVHAPESLSCKKSMFLFITVSQRKRRFLFTWLYIIKQSNWIEVKTRIDNIKTTPLDILQKGFATSSWSHCNAPVILSRFGRYVVLTLFTLTFRRNWCRFRLGATLCHDVLRCCHATATPESRYCPVLTRLTSDTGKFSYVVLRYVSLPPRCSLAAVTLLYAVPRCASLLPCGKMKQSVSQRVRNVR